MQEMIINAIKAVIKDLFNADIEPTLTRANEQFGDYATNAAMQTAKQAGKPPREIAEALVKELPQKLSGQVAEVTMAGPGFVNIRLSDEVLTREIASIHTLGEAYGECSLYKGQTIVAEYSDPNPFKVLHAGHLYTSVVGDAIANLLAAAGGEVHRVNFGGDVGMHVAKTMWAILRNLGGEYSDKLGEVPADERSDWMAEAYVRGTQAYEEDEAAKTEIIALNKRVYQIHADNDRQSALARIYWTCRQWSYEYFDTFYARIGSKFEKYYPESETAPVGLAVVKEQLTNGVYQESDGAVVFDGEKYGLHTRVFINSEGLPTYEAKDVGLIMLKKRDYNFDRSVVITANEQEQYMAVVLKSIEQFAPELTHATMHLTHGIVKLKGGVKMSSRKGNFLRAVDVLEVSAEANRAQTGTDNPDAVLGAVKYAFLKQRMGADIIYDPEESVSILGNSGPYLQYAHARACSILNNSKGALKDYQLDSSERSLVVKMGEFPEVVQKAAEELMPHYVATYLHELAQVFNRFYEHNRVVGDAREQDRFALVAAYATVLKNGLTLLGIPAPERM